jgi:hypothetical protein
MTSQTINIHEAYSLEEKMGKYIIGIKNGVAMVMYPNKTHYRTEAAAEGFDIITVDEQQANLIWKKTINLSVEIVDLKECDRKI